MRAAKAVEVVEWVGFDEAVRLGVPKSTLSRLISSGAIAVEERVSAQGRTRKVMRRDDVLAHLGGRSVPAPGSPPAVRRAGAGVGLSVLHPDALAALRRAVIPRWVQGTVAVSILALVALVGVLGVALSRQAVAAGRSVAVITEAYEREAKRNADELAQVKGELVAIRAEVSALKLAQAAPTAKRSRFLWIF